MALLPDLDQGSSTASHMWGPVSKLASRPVAFASHGHRKGTHDLVVAPVVFGLLAWAASWVVWGQVVLLAVAVGLALCSLSAAIPGRQPWDSWPVNLAVSGAAGWLLATHAAAPWWLPVAVAAGVVVHCLGDLITVEGLPVPFSWIGGSPSYIAFSPLHASSRLLNGAAAVASFAVVGWCGLSRAGYDPVAVVLGG